MDKELQPNRQAMELCPCGILILDGAGTILRANRAIELMTGLNAEQLVGQNSEQTSSPALQTMLSNEALIQLVSSDAENIRYLYCTVADGEDDESIRYYQDVTEQTQLREQNGQLQQQVQELAITDELTGLANPRALNRALNTQVTRSRRYGNPLSLIIAELSDNNAPQEQLPDSVILSVSRHLRYRLRWADTISRWDHNQFVIILPETGQQDCEKLLTKIRKGFSDIALPDEQVERSLVLQFGTTQWQKGDDSRKLMRKAVQNLTSEEALATNSA